VDLGAVLPCRLREGRPFGAARLIMAAVTIRRATAFGCR
jgi:hypothetical protein